jgi:thiamine-monophosphate kinase
MESEFLDWVRQQGQQQFAALNAARRIVAVGIGDDAAVLNALGVTSCVVTTDLLCEGVHFRRAQTTAELIGRKALAVNLSDLAAMAARPAAAFVSLLLPRDSAAELARGIVSGMRPLADEFDVAIAGGDTNTWGGELVISVTAIGLAVGRRPPLLRSGAKPNDVLLVTGQLGGSLLGHHLTFVPRVREALLLNERYRLHAAMDISDGLALDLRRLAAASNCGAIVVADQIPVSAAAKELETDDRPALDHALGDGEDFELLLAAPPEVAAELLRQQPLDVPLTAIGRCTAEPGLSLQLADGRQIPLPHLGYTH